MTKKRRTSNRSKYINYQELEEYGLGSWLKKNASGIGTIAGAAAGSIIAPGIGTSIGATVGGQFGSNIQQNALQEEITKEQSRVTSQQKAFNQAQENLNRLQADGVHSYTPVYCYGGKFRRMAHGGKVPVLNTTLADNSIYSYGTGYSGQQLAPHSELTGTIQEITIPRYRYATNSQPSGYYRTMTTRNPEGVVNTREFTDKGWEDFLADPCNAS